MDSNEIKAVIQIYFDSCFEGSGEKMGGILNNAAHVYGHGRGGVFVDMDRDAFLKIIGPAESGAPRPEYPRQDEILSIDFTGENTAIARVKIRVGDILFTDILSFIRLEGKWTIISKLFSGVPVS